MLNLDRVGNFFISLVLIVGCWSEIMTDIDGDTLHSSVGFPPALSVTTAKVGKLEILVGN